MGRPHIEFIRAQDVPESPAQTPFEGAAERRLSSDAETGASTALLTCPAGWSADLAAGSRPLELFALRGELRLGGEPLRPGIYVSLESGLEEAVLVATADALVLAMIEEEQPPGPTGSWRILDTEQMEYEPSSVIGLVIKKLRIDPERGDWTWLAASAPNRVTPRAEIHPTVEEAFLIRGDCLLGGRGEMTPGSYFWRPGMVRHGPLATRNGTFFFFRTKGGGLETTYAEVPGWQETVHAYRGAEPYFRGAV
jgi:hypothetical protein